MSSLTVQKLEATVGAEVVGVQCEQLLHDADLPAAVMGALEESGVLVFRELHIDDQTQIAFSKKLDDVGKAEPADPPPIYTVSLDPAKSRNASATLGTFNWHIDGAQDDVPTKASMLSVRATSPLTGATRSSPAPTPPTTTARTRRRGAGQDCA